MDIILLFITFLASLLAGIVSIFFLKPKIRSMGVLGKDINKAGTPEVPESCGMPLLIPIWSVILILMYAGLVNPLAYVFLFTVTCFAAVGFFDDCFRFFKKEHNWKTYALKRGAVLVMITLPFSFLVSFQYGLIAVLISSAVIIISASFTNSFAGLNGWEIGSSLILVCALLVMLSFSTVYTSSLLLFAMVLIGAITALLVFNSFPASAFPGDSGTLLIGSFIGCLILFVDPFYLALPLFLPHLLDLALKFKTNRTDMSQKSERPYVLKDGKLHLPSSGRMDFAKLLIRRFGPLQEKCIVKRIWVIVGLNSAFWTILFVIAKTSI